VDAGGVPSGDDFQISVGTTDDRTSPSVATLPGGEFLVAWENSTDAGEFASARTFDDAGLPGAVVVLEAADPDVNVFDPVVVAADAGHFVVVWETYDSNLNESAFRGRRVDAAGTAQGVVFTLESAAANDFVGSGSVAPRAGDGFLLAWQFSGVAGREARVRAFDAAGAPDGASVVIADATDPSYPQVAGLDDDGFVVAWRESVDGLKRQRFEGDGGVNAVVDVTASTTTPRNAVLTEVPGGRAALAWVEAGSGPTPDRVFLQLIDASDSATDFEVAQSEESQSHPGVAYDGAAGELLVVWTRRGGAGADQEEILMRRYALDGIFSDGFESGDVSAWSALIGGP
ncbi:MAG: hypothetical protein AAFY88_24165, partial [Acidobacteriota bacterium]